jgi:hypothetical protein
LITRYLKKIRQHGLRGSIARAASRVQENDHWIWHELALDDELPDRKLPDGMTLVRAEELYKSALSEVGEVSPEIVESRLANGGHPWVVVEDGQVAFACWIYPDGTPLEFPPGWLPLPDDAVALEHSVASPHFRGRGTATGAWVALAEHYGKNAKTMITVVTADNIPTLKAVAKVGFRPAANLYVRVRLGKRTCRRVDAIEPGIGEYLAANLPA